MSMSDTAAQAAIGAAARELHLPTVRDEALRLAQIAVRERQTYLAFLAEVLAAELDERSTRRRTRRITEARFPRLKLLADFDLSAAPTIQSPSTRTSSKPAPSPTDSAPAKPPPAANAPADLRWRLQRWGQHSRRPMGPKPLTRPSRHQRLCSWAKVAPRTVQSGRKNG